MAKSPCCYTVNRHLTVQEFADEMGIRIGSCYQILIFRYVAHLLTDNQEDNRVEVSQELHASANSSVNFLENISAAEERWVCGFDVETKIQSSQLLRTGSHEAKK